MLHVCLVPKVVKQVEMILRNKINMKFNLTLNFKTTCLGCIQWYNRNT